MKIEQIQVGHVAVPMARPMRTAIHSTTHTHNALVQIRAEGVDGQGAALTMSEHQARAVCSMITDLAPMLTGEDAGQVRVHWERMRQRLNHSGRSGIGLLALSAVDTALWDLLAQSARLPLHRLLGTAHTELPVYAQGGWLSDPLEQVVDEAVGFQEQGYRHYKMRVGSPDWRQDVERVTRVRDALDADTHLLADANQGWRRTDALAAARALEPLGLYWLEEPVDAEDVEGCAEVAAAVSTPIATGESVFGAAGFRPLVQRRAASVLMPDLQHCGGPTGFLQVTAQICDAGLAVSSHLFTEVSTHLLAACPGALLVEYMPGWWDDLFDRPLDITAGTIRPPDEPGIGFRFTSAAAERLTPV